MILDSEVLHDQKINVLNYKVNYLCTSILFVRARLYNLHVHKNDSTINLQDDDDDDV